MIDKIKSLKGKIFIGYLLVVIILVMVALWSINNFINLSNSIDNILVENYQSIKASESMIESLERQDSAHLMILNGQIDEGKNTFKEHERDFLKWLARAEDNITINGEEKIIEDINDKYLEYMNSFERFINLEDEENGDFYHENILTQFYNIKDDIRELRAVNQEEMVKAQEKADNRANKAVISTIIISVIAIAVAIVFGLYLSNLILRPIKQLEKAIKSVADRNFNQKINVKSENEIGKLAKEFNKMIEKLQEYEKININKLVDERDKSKAIVDNITSPLLVTDAENRVTLINQEAKDLFDIEEDNLNTHFLELINNEDLFNFINNKQESEQEDQTVTIIKDDKECHYKVSSNTVFDKEGEIKYTVTLLEDITKLKEIDEMKSEFVSTVSHEFRTPLTSMNMSLSMLLSEDAGEINDEQRELLEATFEDCERLNNLVNDLLDLSRIESGKIQMEFEKNNVKNLIETTIEPFQKQAEEKGIDLYSRDIEENIMVWADSNKVSWVISNLIGNALRYTFEGGEIVVDARKKDQYVNISVEDTGVGIPKEYQDKIFDKFIRANNNDDNASGTGLGLAISKEIIEAHNGKIWVESEEGEGSKFTFSVPRYSSISK
ncbi:MAG: ATP-binding protein [Halanaerobiales bacterium]